MSSLTEISKKLIAISAGDMDALVTTTNEFTHNITVVDRIPRGSGTGWSNPAVQGEQPERSTDESRQKD